jgi:hypothetical protein
MNDWEEKLASIIDQDKAVTRTLAQAQGQLFKKLLTLDLVKCPCCRGKAKVYRRPLGGAMAVGIAVLTRRSAEGEFVHVPTVIAEESKHFRASSAARFQGGDIVKLVHWGFLDPMPGTRDDGSNRVGWYRVTPSGRAFALGQASTQSRVILYQGECFGLDGDDVFIQDVLPKAFNYDELMR